MALWNRKPTVSITDYLQNAYVYQLSGMGFTHHFTLHPLIWQIFSLISWLYFSTMWILWGRKCDYWVFHITHAKKGLPNHSSSTRDLKDFFSICDVENTILTYPPHSILSMYTLDSTKNCQKVYSHLSNKRGAWNKRGGVPKMENHQMWRG